MISTLSSFALISRNMKTSLDRVASQPSVKRELDYYNKTIGSISSVDAFMADRRVYTFAMKSFGLEDMAYAKAFIRKVLESDLTDSGSFANRLSDHRYREFAAAYGFASKKTDVQNQVQEDKLIGLYKRSYADEEDKAKTETGYFSQKIGTIGDVDQFLADDRLRNYAFRAFGIDPTYVSRSFMRSVLMSDSDDPDSFANQQAKPSYAMLARQFSFNADGTVAGDAIQSQEQTYAVVDAYNVTVPSFTTQTAARYNAAYYEKAVGAISSRDEFLADDRLLSFIRSAYGLSQSLSKIEFRLILESDPDNPSSYAALVGATDLVRAFNFGADGTLADGEQAQTDEQMQGALKAYDTRHDQERSDTVDKVASNYAKRMADVTTLKGFLVSNKDDKDISNNKLPELYQVALRAYGISADEVSLSQLKKILTSNPDDPKSYLAGLKDKRFEALAKAFNFDAGGKADAPPQALGDVKLARWIGDYSARSTMLLSGAALDRAKKDIKAEAEYFSKTIAGLTKMDDLLKDRRLTDFLIKAVGLDPKKTTPDVLKKAFTSDGDNPRSFFNTQADPKLKALVAAFNFDKSGEVVRSRDRAFQGKTALEAIDQLYLNQVLELQQGNMNDGVRLALYFQRKASDITSYYTLLGDKALFEVVSTAFSLPSQIFSMKVEKQAAILKRFVSLDDLQNIVKVQSLLKRFSALYDSKNSSSADHMKATIRPR